MKERPTIVCLCGSTRFKTAFQNANLEETLAGRIVLTVGSMTHSDAELGARITPAIKAQLDELHKRKIDLADEILVLNVNDYIGESTRGEIAYALSLNKRIRFYETFKTIEPFSDVDQTWKAMDPKTAEFINGLFLTPKPFCSPQGEIK